MDLTDYSLLPNANGLVFMSNTYSCFVLSRVEARNKFVQENMAGTSESLNRLLTLRHSKNLRTSLIAHIILRMSQPRRILLRQPAFLHHFNNELLISRL